MIYLIFDSDVWLNSLKESGEEDNYMDSLEFWINDGFVKILLPEIIITEWDRNRDEKKRVLIKEWRSFYQKVKEELGTDVVKTLNTPDVLDAKVEKQLKKVEDIFQNHAIKIPISSNHKLLAAELALEKKAPFRNKNSMGDAIIYFSMTSYIEIEGLSKCIFITNNKNDFSHDDFTDKIHPDLEDTFKKLDIDYYIDLRRFFHDYANQLPNPAGYKKLQALKEEDKKLASAVLNPQTLENLTGLRDSYIENVNHLDLILKTKNPTKEQVHFALGLVDSDESYKQYFFKKVDGIVWFKILKDRDVFNPLNNPSPIKVKEGFQIAYWEPLSYLEKLTNQIDKGKELELVDEIITIIKNVSENPKDNFRTWYVLTKILTTLPNDKVSKDILNYIPVWLKGSFDTMLQSSELCKKLLPKFLSDKPTKEDIEKSEIILKHLFAIEKLAAIPESVSGISGSSYFSRVQMYNLSNAFAEKKLISNIAKYCSNDIIYLLANNLKLLFYDFPNGINFTIKSYKNEYNIKGTIEDKNISVSIVDKTHPDSVLVTAPILNFENYGELQIKEKLLIILNEAKIEYLSTEDNEFNIKLFTNALINGSFNSYHFNSIGKLNDRYLHGEKITEVFALIFRDILNEKIKQKPVDAIQILNQFSTNNFYRHAFYRRILFFVIGENWDESKSIFWEQIKNKDTNHYFSNHRFDKELYELLNKNQSQLTVDEINLLRKIIDAGPQDEKDDRDPKYFDYWRLRWYSALRNTESFKIHYEKHSEAQNITHDHYENIGEVITRVGSVAPFSVHELLQKSNEEIVKYINEFKPKDRWEEPSIDGLSGALGKAVENEPEKFANEIALYNSIFYIYAYHILNGFREAWKNKKSFDWKKVLDFCKAYISNEKFYSGQLSLENDGWNATAEWVIGTIGNLLTEGMQSDSNAFDLYLLPSAKEIIQTLAVNLKPLDDFKETNMDYPTYSLNSTAGKVLRALLDYSLRRARDLKSKKSVYKWEDDVKAIIEGTYKKGVVDSYILTGWYYEQFYFLDKDWLSTKVFENLKLGDKEWFAFMGGFVFGNPPFNKEVYKLFYPHYERAIKNNFGLYDHGVIRHLVTFYFWGFEDLGKEGLMLMFLKFASPAAILELVNFVWRQESYLKSLDAKEAVKIQEKVLNLWSYLSNKYQNTQVQEEQNILANLSNLLVFVPVLNETITNLVLISCKFLDKHFHFHFIIENLIKLKFKGNPSETAKYVGQILNSIPFGEFFSSIDNLPITELVTFLYENNQKTIADEFCNKLTKQYGQEFLIEIYNKYQI